MRSDIDVKTLALSTKVLVQKYIFAVLTKMTAQTAISKKLG